MQGNFKCFKNSQPQIYFSCKEQYQSHIIIYFRRNRKTQKFSLLLQSLSHMKYSNIKLPTVFLQIAHCATRGTCICNLTSVFPKLFCKCILSVLQCCHLCRLVQQGSPLNTELSQSSCFLHYLFGCKLLRYCHD